MVKVHTLCGRFFFVISPKLNEIGVEGESEDAMKAGKSYFRISFYRKPSLFVPSHFLFSCLIPRSLNVR